MVTTVRKSFMLRSGGGKSLMERQDVRGHFEIHRDCVAQLSELFYQGADKYLVIPIFCLIKYIQLRIHVVSGLISSWLH